MARVAIPIVEAVGSVSPAHVLSAGVAADSTNGHEWDAMPGDLLVAFNTGVAGRNMTLLSQDDALGRDKDEVITVAAGGFAFCGRFQPQGWRVPSGGDVGKQQVDVADDTDIKLVVVRGLDKK